MTTRGREPRVAFVTCEQVADLDPDDRLAVRALAARGVAAQPAVWDDPDVDWAGYDLAVLRSTWDYPERRDEFLAWIQRVPRLANPADVVAWNTEKGYLAELAARGAPVVRTHLLAPGDPAWPVPEAGVWVVKPTVGAGSWECGRYDLSDPEQRELAGTHAERLRAAGRTVLVQPYLADVDRDGETALIFLGGRYSHAIRKDALLDGPYTGLTDLYKHERISGREPTPAQHSAARRVLDAAGEILGTGPAGLLYARVDLLPGGDGQPLLLELELTEPSLFLGYAPGAAERFADAVLAHLDRLADLAAGRA